MLDDEINNILGELYIDLATLRLKCEFFEKPDEYNSIKKERKLRILAKKKKRINEIERLKEEVKPLRTNYQKVKLKFLNYFLIQNMKNMMHFYHLNLCYCESKSNLKQYFNDKSLIVYVNHVLLGFLFMSVQNT